MPSNSRPLVSRPVSTTIRSSPEGARVESTDDRAEGASVANSGQDASHELTSDGYDDADRAGDRRRDARELVPDRRLQPPLVELVETIARGELDRRQACTAYGDGQVDLEAHPLGVRGGVVVDLRGVAVIGRQVELVERLALERGGPGGGGLLRVRPRRLRRVADDRPRRVAAPAPDHPPLHRGEVLDLVDEHVGERVVLDPVGRGVPAPAGGELAVGGRGELLQVAADVVV